MSLPNLQNNLKFQCTQSLKLCRKFHQAELVQNAYIVEVEQIPESAEITDIAGIAGLAEFA